MTGRRRAPESDPPTTEASVIKPPPAPPTTNPLPLLSPEAMLRQRLTAALRPRMTLQEASMTVEQILPEVQAYADVAVQAAFAAHADLIGQVITTAQDCLETMTAGSS